MLIITALFLFSSLAVGYGSLCTDLSGTWKNQLNSNMTIMSVTENRFTGHYHTAVESTQGAARLSSKISGMIQPVENGKLIGFNVLWNRGASLTAWVGQCMVCDGKEKIYTTWVLRSYQPIKKRWMTTRINQDTFWRIEEEDTSEHNEIQAPQSSISESEVLSEGMQGKWMSNSGSSFDINVMQTLGEWKGTHLTEGEIGGVAVGRFDGNDTYTAVGFVGLSDNKIKGWTGHIDKQVSTPKIMESSWLEHTFHESCSNPRKYVQFGMDNYQKSE